MTLSLQFKLILVVLTICLTVVYSNDSAGQELPSAEKDATLVEAVEDGILTVNRPNHQTSRVAIAPDRPCPENQKRDKRGECRPVFRR